MRREMTQWPWKKTREIARVATCALLRLGVASLDPLRLYGSDELYMSLFWRVLRSLARF